MFIWSGLGFIVAVIAFLFLFCAEYVVESLLQDDNYYQAHGWPKLLAFWLAAACVWVVSTYLNKKQGRVFIDKDSGEEVLLKPQHSLFFINISYWSYILLALGIVFLFF